MHSECIPNREQCHAQFPGTRIGLSGEPIVWSGSLKNQAKSHEEKTMIEVIVGYKVKDGADMQPILLNLRSHAMTYPGFVRAENLRSEADSSIIAMLQTWDRVESWRFWETSKTNPGSSAGD